MFSKILRRTIRNAGPALSVRLISDPEDVDEPSDPPSYPLSSSIVIYQRRRSAETRVLSFF